jgi:hypothetical protein
LKKRPGIVYLKVTILITTYARYVAGLVSSMQQPRLVVIAGSAAKSVGIRVEVIIELRPA